MRVWAIYSDHHTEVDVRGDQDGLRALAAALTSGQSKELTLENPPNSWRSGDEHVLDSIRLEPSQESETRIRFQRDALTLVVSGHSGELARIVGGAITGLADAPRRSTTWGAHVHLDPTSD